LDLRIRLYRI